VSAETLSPHMALVPLESAIEHLSETHRSLEAAFFQARVHLPTEAPGILQLHEKIGDALRHAKLLYQRVTE
jgi:hypothetical protein